jgi:hypothetical protein
VANLIGCSPETINAIVYRGRVPGAGMINAVARVLNMDDEYVRHLLDLRQKDNRQKKINKLTNSSNKEGIPQMSTLLEVLNEEQIEAVRKVALKFAVSNIGGKR